MQPQRPPSVHFPFLPQLADTFHGTHPDRKKRPKTRFVAELYFVAGVFTGVRSPVKPLPRPVPCQRCVPPPLHYQSQRNTNFKISWFIGSQKPT